jgi:hypothetical protein
MHQESNERNGISERRGAGMAASGRGSEVVWACVRAEATTGGENTTRRDAVHVINNARCAGIATGGKRNNGGRREI